VYACLRLSIVLHVRLRYPDSCISSVQPKAPSSGGSKRSDDAILCPSGEDGRLEGLLLQTAAISSAFQHHCLRKYEQPSCGEYPRVALVKRVLEALATHASAICRIEAAHEK
jgi:hypothetical protein